LAYLVAQLGVGLWVYTFPGQAPLILPPVPLDAFTICIDQVSPRLGNSAVAYLLMDCAFDFVIIVLTTYKSVQSISVVGNPFTNKGLLARIVRDGVLYFVFIFSNNLAWSIMVLTAPAGLKWTCAMPSIAFVATMVNRITINLKAEAHRPIIPGDTTLGASFSQQRTAKRPELASIGGKASWWNRSGSEELDSHELKTIT